MEVLLDTTMLHPITLFRQQDRLMMLYLNADGEMQIGEIAAGRLHPVRSVEGVVEDCGVCSYSSNVNSEPYLRFKADGQRRRVQHAKKRYGFMIVASDGIKRYILKQR